LRKSNKSAQFQAPTAKSSNDHHRQFRGSHLGHPSFSHRPKYSSSSLVRCYKGQVCSHLTLTALLRSQPSSVNKIYLILSSQRSMSASSWLFEVTPIPSTPHLNHLFSSAWFHVFLHEQAYSPITSNIFTLTCSFSTSLYRQVADSVAISNIDNELSRLNFQSSDTSTKENTFHIHFPVI
jgi:hypothetical protein